jgi:acetyl-CoA C-acetyltransferase
LEEVFIVSAVRTPIGKFGGSLAGMTAADMGVVAGKAAMERAAVQPGHVEETIFGNARQAGGGPNVARQISIRSGVPQEVPAYTVNMACASGMKAIALGYQEIANGNLECVLVGGTESMSRLPYYLEGARWGLRMGNGELVDGVVHDGLTDPLLKVHMGTHGSTVAAEEECSREQQDTWALRSHQRAIAAMDSGRFAEEIVPVVIHDKKRGDITVDTDESPRRDTSMEALAKLKPVFDPNGTVTAGNAPGLNDGAAAVVVASAEYAKAHGLKPLAHILGYGEAAWDTPYLAYVPAMAGKNALKKLGMTVDDLDLVELNEAFASVALISMAKLGLSEDKVNVNGGAVALGHPIGASGARLIITLIHELRRRGGGIGMAAICSGTAQGDAIILQVGE